jgi:hypothetical protein
MDFRIWISLARWRHRLKTATSTAERREGVAAFLRAAVQLRDLRCVRTRGGRAMLFFDAAARRAHHEAAYRMGGLPVIVARMPSEHDVYQWNTRQEDGVVSWHTSCAKAPRQALPRRKCAKPDLNNGLS